MPSKDDPALLIIDMFSKFDFPDAAALAPSAVRAARQIARLKEAAAKQACPVIYINDNFAEWKRDFKELVEICLQTPGTPGTIAKLLLPTPDDYSILKPKHSAFLSTPLSILLAKLGSRRLLITGTAADSCIAATCFDANSREYETLVVREAVAGIGARKTRALKLIEDAQAAKVVPIETVLKALR